MIQMIALDLDGTLFNDEKKISEATRKILQQAMTLGIEVVPATGRPYCGVSEEVMNFPGIHYILTTNGAGVYEREDNRCIYENSMKLEQFLPLMARLEPLDIMADAFVKGECYMSQKNRALIDAMDTTPEMKQYMKDSRTCVPLLTEYLRERGDDVQKITMNFVKNEDGRLRDYDEALRIIQEYPEFIYVSGGLGNLEVTDRSASKGEALLKLGERLGIGKNEIIAFGDSGNDVAMLQAAGVGVAMGNAESEALEVADFITKTNNEDGIVFALKKYISELNG